MKPFWIRRAARFLIFGTLFVSLVGWVVMALWNALLPQILGVTTITFWQALGLLVLSRILFGGFGRGGGWGGRGPGDPSWKQKMAERWKNLTPEQREEMKANWKDRCRKR